MSPPPVDNIQRARETRAWDLRARGLSQSRIAEALGITQPAVSKLLRRVERRELRRLSAAIESLKAVQSAQLDYVIGESLSAWERSKMPRKRAASKRSIGGDGDGQGDGGDEVQTTEVVERDGDTGYLYAAMQALSHQRSLWGLDVAPALQEPAASVAELARDLFARGAAYEQRRAAEAPGNGAEPPGGGSEGGPVRLGSEEDAPASMGPQP